VGDIDTRAGGMLAMTSEVMEFRERPRMMRPVQSIDTLAPPTAAASHVGGLVREWRTTRRLSQLELALEANVSPRHLSCVETGKAQPSRDMIARLADALGMPLRERNALLVAAGFAPRYRETELTSPEMAPIRRAIEFILQHQEPYPAVVMNRHWDILLMNDSIRRILERLRPGGPRHANMLRQIFDPQDIRGVLRNWEELAIDILRHMHNQVAMAPSDTKARALLDEILAYPDVPAQWRTRELGSTPQPLLNTVFGKDDLELRFFSTITTFGTPHDVTLDELRIECSFPADDATAEFCRKIMSG
jgi:transcriptional regulator with XRE-family HTH domain